jgi:hypothetical protein
MLEQMALSDSVNIPAFHDKPHQYPVVLISLLKISVHACVLSSDKEQKDSFHFCGYRWQLPLPWEHSKGEMCCCEHFELNLKKPSPLGLCLWWVLHIASAIQAYISMFNIS